MEKENKFNGRDCLNNPLAVLNMGDYGLWGVYLIRHGWLGNCWPSNMMNKVQRAVGLKS